MASINIDRPLALFNYDKLVIPLCSDNVFAFQITDQVLNHLCLNFCLNKYNRFGVTSSWAVDISRSNIQDRAGLVFVFSDWRTIRDFESFLRYTIRSLNDYRVEPNCFGDIKMHEWGLALARFNSPGLVDESYIVNLGIESLCLIDSGTSASQICNPIHINKFHLLIEKLKMVDVDIYDWAIIDIPLEINTFSIYAVFRDETTASLIRTLIA